MTTEPSSAPPDAVLRAVAGELELLQGISHTLEDALINTVNEAKGDHLAPKKRQVMQDFDLLAQSLDGLRIYLGQLAVAATGRDALSVEEALQSVKLGAMRDRLSNLHDDPGSSGQGPKQDPEQSPHQNDVVRGQVDFF